MIEESNKPSISSFKYRNRNNVLGCNSKTMRLMDKTAFEMYNSKTKGRNIGSPGYNSSMMQSFSSSRRHECNTLREQLQKITVDLDSTLSQPQKARRTRKERKLNTMTNNSRNGTTVIHDNTSFNNVEKESKLKCKQIIRNSDCSHLDNHSNTARERGKFKLSVKENTKIILQATSRTNNKLNKVVPVHRRCFTRIQNPMIQSNAKEKKGVGSKVGDIGRPTYSSVSKRNIISKQSFKLH
jgi:hypothetical protein